MELKYPSHRKTLATKSGGVQGVQTACTNATTKNGNQQAIKTPVIIANVLAAFLSRLASIVSRAFLAVVIWGCEPCVTIVVDIGVVIIVDWVKFAPFDDDFSGDADELSGVVRVIVNAVDSSLGLYTKNKKTKKYIHNFQQNK